MSEPSKAHVRLVPRVKSPVAPSPVKPPQQPSSFSEHDAITRRVVLSPDEPDDAMDSMEMTAVRPESRAASFDASLDVTVRRAPAPAAGDPAEIDGDAGETIALPARRARAVVAGARPAGVANASDPGPHDGRVEGNAGAARTDLVDARSRLVAAGAGRTRPQGHTPDPRQRRS